MPGATDESGRGCRSLKHSIQAFAAHRTDQTLHMTILEDVSSKPR